MKSQMPYHGVPATALRALCRQVYSQLELPAAAAFRAQVLAIWRQAQFREERYAAIELTGHRMARGFQDMDAVPMYEEMIVSGAWWDYVDVLATNRLSTILQKEPVAMAALMRGWSRCDDLWKRRSAILCQLPRKQNTDLALLQDCIEPALPSREFFLRKAIGWALRHYARTDPAWVLHYVRTHRDALSPLSQREALKHIGGGELRFA